MRPETDPYRLVEQCPLCGRLVVAWTLPLPLREREHDRALSPEPVRTCAVCGAELRPAAPEASGVSQHVSGLAAQGYDLVLYSDRRNVVALIGPRADRCATMFAGSGPSPELATDSALRHMRTVASVSRPEADESPFRRVGVTLQWGVFEEPGRYALRCWRDRAPVTDDIAVGSADRCLLLITRALARADG